MFIKSCHRILECLKQGCGHFEIRKSKIPSSKIFLQFLQNDFIVNTILVIKF